MTRRRYKYSEYTESRKRANLKYQKKKSEERKAKKATPTLFIACNEVLRKSIQIPGGLIIDVQDASDDDFYRWFQSITSSVVEALLRQGKYTGGVQGVQRDIDAFKYDLDDNARWFFILEVYRLPVFHLSGVQLFATREVFA